MSGNKQERERERWADLPNAESPRERKKRALHTPALPPPKQGEENSYRKELSSFTHTHTH